MRISDWSSDVCSSDLRQRPLLLQTYSAADAFAYTDVVKRSPHGDLLIRGKAARWARHDPRPCQVGPSGTRTILDRKSVVEGKRVSVRVDPGGIRIIKKKKYTNIM